MNKNPLKLMQIEKRLLEKRMVVMGHKVTQVKEMVHRKRAKHSRKKRKQMRMALSLKLRQIETNIDEDGREI